MSLLSELRNDVNGLALLTDWLGDGGEPVSQEEADARAEVCLKCPQNTAPLWWEIVKNTIAQWIRNELEVKNKIGLKVKDEERLHMCKVCGCCLSLKCWTPIQYILDHVPSEKIESSPSFCWMRRKESTT